LSIFGDSLKLYGLYFNAISVISKTNWIKEKYILARVRSAQLCCHLRIRCAHFFHSSAVRCAQIYIPCTYKLLSCTKLREWFGVNFWQMLQDTFATSQIHFVFEITLVALKYEIIVFSYMENGLVINKGVHLLFI
jgi:hypothetical protein